MSSIEFVLLFISLWQAFINYVRLGVGRLIFLSWLINARQGYIEAPVFRGVLAAEHMQFVMQKNHCVQHDWRHSLKHSNVQLIVQTHINSKCCIWQYILKEKPAPGTHEPFPVQEEDIDTMSLCPQHFESMSYSARG